MKTRLLLPTQFVNWRTPNLNTDPYHTVTTRRCVRRPFVRFAAQIFATAFLCLLTREGQAAGTTWYVDGSLGTDTSTCGSTPGLGACRTIQFAVNKAVSGDTISVAAGGYLENVVINKILTVNGAQPGNPVAGRTF